MDMSFGGNTIQAIIHAESLCKKEQQQAIESRRERDTDG